ncbi:MAG: HD domain-containing protein, partial [candidate division KSB1 bacterium]|nr:HD domain-containing protein [candidate division KSB1 bacterium]
HVRAVAQVALKSAEILASSYRDYYTINMDYLISGVLLHDVGKFLEFQKDRKKISKSRAGKLLRHPISGAGLAMKHGLPDEVVHIIAVHSQEGEGGYRSPEAVIVHHADFMNFESLK